MYILSLNIAYIKPVGEISESRFQLIKEKLAAYPEIEKGPNLLVFKSGNTGIAIHPAQLTFVAGGLTELKADEIIDQLDSVNAILGLTDTTKLIMVLEGLNESKASVMKLSSELHRKESEILSSIGVGLRFMVEAGEIKGDIRIEPFIKDETKIFYHVALETKELVPTSDLKSLLHKMLFYGINNAEEASKLLFEG